MYPLLLPAQTQLRASKSAFHWVLLVLAFALFSPTGESQTTSSAWHPLPDAFRSKRYDYIRGDHHVPQHPVEVERITTENLDTTWHFYPYPELINTSFAEAWHARHYPGTCTFLGHALRRDASGTYWFEEADCTLVLHAASDIGHTWDFHPCMGISARVDSIWQDSLFGTALDSVKQIVLSTPDTILLSRKHGILRWPSGYAKEDSMPYRLSGIADMEDGDHLGRPLPDWKAMFRMLPGTDVSYQAGLKGHRDFEARCTIDWLEEYADSIVVGVSGAFRIDCYYSDFYKSSCRLKARWTFLPDRATYRFVHDPSESDCPCGEELLFMHQANTPPMRFVPHFYHWGVADPNAGPQHPFGASLFHFEENEIGRWMRTRNKGPYRDGRYSGLFDWSFSFGQNNRYEYREESEGIANCTYGWDAFDLDAHYLMEGLGVRSMHITGIDYIEGFRMTAYRIGDEAWGTPIDISWWPVGHAALAPTSNIKAFPNPSTGLLFISGWDKPGMAMVYNATGKAVLEQSFQSGTPLDLSTLPNGLYWIELRNDEQRGLAKVSLMRP